MQASPQSPDTSPNKLQSIIEQINIAESLDEEKLAELGKKVVDGYTRDVNSRREWEKKYEDWIKLATLAAEQKTWPWVRASNVKYPLIATAAMQFSARAYPTLVPNNGQVVKGEVVGKDPTGQKKERADRIGVHMSYQLLKEMCSWEEDMDKLLIMLPIIGTCFKKTYWDKLTEQNVSELVLPKDLVVNYWTKTMENAERITQRIEMSPRLLKERQLSKLFLDVELEAPRQDVRSVDKRLDFINVNEDDETTPYILLEQHTFADLDDDGYPEPYIITVDEHSEKVLRITPRFRMEDVKTNDKGDVSSIRPTLFFTKYGFIPNPDGSFYDIGFGLLLGPLNESVNTLINQLVDAGTLSNLQSGFIGKGLRLKTGEQRFTPGEWKPVNATGDDLKKQIVPLPAKEPSNVLFELLGTLIQSGKELASVAEIFVGKMPGQNTPATTTMATIEQGMKVFTAIYKRVYRSLTKEYKKLFKLNSIYLNNDEYVKILDAPIGPQDYNEDDYDVCPTADPGAVSESAKMVKAQALMEMMALGTLDPMAVTMRILEAQEQASPEKLIRQGPPPPDPKVAIEQMKAQTSAQESQAKMAMDQQKMAAEMQLKEKNAQLEMQMKQMEMAFKEKEAQLTLQVKQMEAAVDMQATQQKHSLDMKVAVDQHHMQSQQQHETHQQNMQQMKETAKVKPKDKGAK